MKPVLLLIPGMLNDARIWTHLLPEIEDEVQVRIATVSQQASIAEMARDAWALVADLPAQAPWALAGFSMGGYVAIEMLARPQRHPRAAALVSTSGRGESPEASAQREKTLAMMRADFPRAVEGIIKWGTVDPTLAQSEHLRRMMLELGLEVAERNTRAIMGRLDHGQALRSLALPVQVVCGTQDKVTPPVLSEELSQWIPGAHLTMIEQAGHLMPCQQPQALAQALRRLWS